MAAYILDSFDHPPVVSVVIPTCKRPDLLIRSIESATAQTWPPAEIIVVIDGDDPATLSALEALAHPLVKPLPLAQSVGPGAARNAGVAAARGDWIAFLDDDDEWLPDRLAAQRQDMTDAGNDAVFLCAQSYVDTAEGIFVRPVEPYDPAIPLDEWLFDRRSWLKGGQSFLQSSSFLAPRSLWLRSPFPPTRLHEDWEVALRAVKDQGCRLVMAPAPLVRHYMHFNATSLSMQGNWRKSLAWAEGVGSLLSPRAYSGFCLTVATSGAARLGERSACWPLLRAAFSRGRPTPKQMFAWALFWLLPDHLRRKVRTLSAVPLQFPRQRKIMSPDPVP